MQPASSFRSRYANDNLLYLAAGQIIPEVTGKRPARAADSKPSLPLEKYAVGTWSAGSTIPSK